jgi:hypothetical protein
MSLLDFFALLGMVSTPLALMFGVAWWNARKELDMRRNLMYPPLERSTATDAGRLEQSVDAIAVEIERITEGQRFMAKLLAERAAADRAAPDRVALPAPEPRVITPH